MMLYEEKDYAATRHVIKVRVVATALLAAVFVALLVLFLTIWRNVTLAMLASGVGGAVVLFYFVTQLLPWIRYGQYQSDIRHGRAHEMDCHFVSFSQSERISDGVAFHEMIIRLDGTKGADNERLLLWDADKELPPLHEEQPLHIRAFGNYIIGLDVL